MTGLNRVFALVLDARFGHAHGEVEVTEPPENSSVTQRFWSRDNGASWRIERSDGMVFTESPEGYSVRSGRRLIEKVNEPTHRRGLHVPDQMLHPLRAHIWGRRMDDWQVTSDVEERDNVYSLGLIDNEGASSDVCGEVQIDKNTGTITALFTPAYSWKLTLDRNWWPEDEDGLFNL